MLFLKTFRLSYKTYFFFSVYLISDLKLTVLLDLLSIKMSVSFLLSDGTKLKNEIRNAFNYSAKMRSR